MIIGRDVLAEKVRRHLERGGSLDDALALIRGYGGHKIDCIRALKAATDMSLADAKFAVHFSPVWADAKERDERLWDELETLQGSGVPESRPDEGPT